MKVVFMGSPEPALPALKVLIESDYIDLVGVFSQADKPFGRKRVLTPTPVKKMALENGLKVFTPPNFKTAEAYEMLKSLKPDLAIVCGYGQILPENVLQLPPLGMYNIHFSFLPLLRGASPVQTAIKNGYESTGVSLQKIVYKLDSGAIFDASTPLKILDTDTYGTLVEKLSVQSAELLTKCLPDLLKPNPKLTPQIESDATFCRVIKPIEGHLNFNDMTALEIDRTFRAFQPWPGVYVLDKDQNRLVLTKITLLKDQIIDKKIAQLYEPAKITDDFTIGAKQGLIKVEELKPAGKKNMKAVDYLKGNPIAGSFVS